MKEIKYKHTYEVDVTLKSAKERGIEYYKIYINGTYIGFGFGEDDARELVVRHPELTERYQHNL